VIWRPVVVRIADHIAALTKENRQLRKQIPPPEVIAGKNAEIRRLTAITENLEAALKRVNSEAKEATRRADESRAAFDRRLDKEFNQSDKLKEDNARLAATVRELEGKVARLNIYAGRLEADMTWDCYQVMGEVRGCNAPHAQRCAKHMVMFAERTATQPAADEREG
jgi:methylaspartate ammonia-lyase